MKNQRLRNLLTIGAFLILFSLNAFAFRGSDPCDYSDCSGINNDIGFFGWIFLIGLSIYLILRFFTESDFRSSIYHVAFWFILVIVIPSSFLKEDKYLAMILVGVMFFVHKWIYSLIEKHKNDTSTEKTNQSTNEINSDQDKNSNNK